MTLCAGGQQMTNGGMASDLREGARDFSLSRGSRGNKGMKINFLLFFEIIYTILHITGFQRLLHVRAVWLPVSGQMEKTMERRSKHGVPFR